MNGSVLLEFVDLLPFVLSTHIYILGNIFCYCCCYVRSVVLATVVAAAANVAAVVARCTVGQSAGVEALCGATGHRRKRALKLSECERQHTVPLWRSIVA